MKLYIAEDLAGWKIIQLVTFEGEGDDEEMHVVATLDCDTLTREQQTANAQAIVNAVNAHDDLLAVVMVAQTLLDPDEWGTVGRAELVGQWRVRARAAIAKAKGD